MFKGILLVSCKFYWKFSGLNFWQCSVSVLTNGYPLGNSFSLPLLLGLPVHFHAYNDICRFTCLVLHVSCLRWPPTVYIQVGASVIQHPLRTKCHFLGLGWGQKRCKADETRNGLRLVPGVYTPVAPSTCLLLYALTFCYSLLQELF